MRRLYTHHSFFKTHPNVFPSTEGDEFSESCLTLSSKIISPVHVAQTNIVYCRKKKSPCEKIFPFSEWESIKDRFPLQRTPFEINKYTEKYIIILYTQSDRRHAEVMNQQLTERALGQRVSKILRPPALKAASVPNLHTTLYTDW